MFYEDYLWKNGQPYGVRACEPFKNKQGILYKIVSDPYHKRICIEKHHGEEFLEIVYDSVLFDFRLLKKGEQYAWQKISILETAESAICHIRDQDDRLILIEKYTFQDNLCRKCQAFSPFGTLISTQKIAYKLFEDPFDGVILYDSNDHKVMSKHYEFDQDKKEFSKLLKEEWEVSNAAKK